jgi:hypothetical protein
VPTQSAPARVVPVPVPRAEQVRTLFATLTGRDVEVGPTQPIFPGRDSVTVSVYVTDGPSTGAVVACDLSLTAYVGAALGLVPLPQVEEAIGAQLLTPDLAENFAEVANVLASVFNGNPDAPQLTHKVHAVGEKLPTDLASMLGYVVRRLDLNVKIAGYGGGTLSVVAIG